MSTFLVTGGAGFIGSNLANTLVQQGESVRVLDDLSTGNLSNLSEIQEDIELFEGSICDQTILSKAMKGVDFCLHQAAIPSVPRSVKSPWASNRANVEGSLNVFLAARDAGVQRLVYASSSSVYGNVKTMPVREELPRNPISPYAVSKAAMEMYGEVFSDLYDLDLVGLRYFNVFGPKQDPNSAYAAVIPIFITNMLKGKSAPVHGDGGQGRDFSYIDNVVSANLLACKQKKNIAGVYNVACGDSTTVLEVVELLNEILGVHIDPEFKSPREGDIRKSWANIENAESAFGYKPLCSVREGLEKTLTWLRPRVD
jgi:UDP-glucose 4-epimerase